MVNEKDVIDLVNNWQDKDRKTMAEFIAELYKDKFVEIYLGDSYEDVSTEQISTNYPAVFCCKVVTAYKECLVLQPLYVEKNKSVKSGGLLFISERAVRALTEIDNAMVLQDMILRSSDSLAVYKSFVKNEKAKINRK